MNRLFASLVFLLVTLGVPALFVGMSSTALAAGTFNAPSYYDQRELTKFWTSDEDSVELLYFYYFFYISRADFYKLAIPNFIDYL